MILHLSLRCLSQKYRNGNQKVVERRASPSQDKKKYGFIIVIKRGTFRNIVLSAKRTTKIRRAIRKK